MTVSCPSCSTRYRLPPRSKLGARPTFRCTRCDHVFDPEESAEAPALDADDADDDAPDLALARDEMEDEPADDEDEPAPRRRRRRRAAEPKEPPVAEGGSGVARFALRSMLTVTLSYAVLSIWLYTHPKRVAELVSTIPIIGEPMSERRISPANIQLADLRGDYHRVQGDTLVFAISGTALNNAPVPVSGVQIQGSIHGAVDQRQTVFAGAAPRAVEALSVREIDLLQTLVPPKEWSLGPGDQASFLVVFKDPPVPLDEFAAEVVAVRRGGRAAPERTAGTR